MVYNINISEGSVPQNNPYLFMVSNTTHMEVWGASFIAAAL